MSVDLFNPTIWANELLVNLNNAHVYAALANRDYEGEIQAAGDTVKIGAIGRITVSDYTKNSDLSSPEALTDAQATLKIDQAKSFNFQIDDVDRAQVKPQLMAGAMREAAYAMSDTVDTFVAALYTDGTPAANLGTTGSPITDVISATKAYSYLVDLDMALNTANVPSQGRFCVIPSWYLGSLLKDSRFVGFGTPFNVATLQNGQVGRVAGMDIYVSNNVPNTAAAKYRIIAGHSIAWSFAEQLISVEAYRMEKRFADAVKGLHVYGAKVVRPAALQVMTANNS